jgi:hypothetical protein
VLPPEWFNVTFLQLFVNKLSFTTQIAILASLGFNATRFSLKVRL